MRFTLPLPLLLLPNEWMCQKNTSLEKCRIICSISRREKILISDDGSITPISTDEHK